MAHNDDDIEQLFRRNYSTMYRLAAIMLHDGEAAKDVVHDIFADLIEKQVDTERLDTGYLMRSVKNRCLNRLRDLNVHERFASLYVMDESEEEIEDWPDSDIFALMEKCIGKLPPKCSEVFNLRFREGMDSAHIMSKLGIGERAVYKHLRHALDILRSKLTPNG